jgi:polar amino acid transport system substrate-binding protein
MKKPIAGLSLLAVLGLMLVLALAAPASAIVSTAGADGSVQCSGSSAGSAGRQAAAAMVIAKRILGHAPRGLAKTVVRRGKVRIANDLNYPPQSFVDPRSHRLVGFDVDVAKKLARILHLKVVWKHPAWARVIPGLRAGRFDVSIGSMTVTPERKKLVSFTRPYYFAGAQVFVKAGGMQITGPDDLAGRTVGVGEGTTYSDYLVQNTEAIVSTYSADLDAVPDLLNGTIDFWMTHPLVGQKAILEGQALEFSGKPLYYEALAMALKQREADWRRLLNYAVKKMHKDGSLTHMSKKWYSGLDLTVKQ